jgi:hypothetical protein
MDQCIIFFECGWILETLSHGFIECSVIQGLSLYFSTRNFLGLSGSRDLKPKRASILWFDSDLWKMESMLEVEMQTKWSDSHITHSVTAH